MLKIKRAQSFLDELDDVDWGDEDLDDLPERFLPKPHGEQGFIDENNYEDFEPSTKEDKIFDLPRDQEAREEIPKANELLGIPQDTKEIEYSSGQQLVYDGIDNNEVVSFDYTNRFGMYSGTRTVEPHYTFVAQGTGNEVLVSFDRDQNNIRAFIVGNIHPFGVRYEEVGFIPKKEIMTGIY